VRTGHQQRQRDIKKILKVTPVAARRRRELARVAEDTLERGRPDNRWISGSE
jgi:hypothetical protein